MTLDQLRACKNFRVYTDAHKTTADKTPLPDGPWMAEPDKVQWIDRATGLDCLIVRNRMGSLCGYVGVPPSHPLYKQEYSADEISLSVHGGLTYSSFCRAGDEAHSICHVPLPGRPDDVWWFGFDCGHAFDLAPGLISRNWHNDGAQYRDIDYVSNEVTALAEQLGELKKS